MHATFQTLDTPDGPFSLLVDDTARVIASGWTADLDALRARLKTAPADISRAETDAARAVEAYYSGDLAAIGTVAVWQEGTALQRAGWDALRAIAPGNPLSYTGFAAALGSPTAVRAAASICARNAPALFVPCHRVLRGDGSLGGFAWGTHVKRALLDREAALGR